MRATPKSERRVVVGAACIALLSFCFATFAQSSNDIAQTKSAMDSILSTGVVGAVCIVQAYMLNRMYCDARIDRQADIVREEKQAAELMKVVKDNAAEFAEVVKDNTKAITLLEARHDTFREASGENLRVGR